MKQARHKRTNTVGFHLYNVPRVVQVIETESRMVIARGRGRGRNGKLLLHGDRVSVLQNEKSAGDLNALNDHGNALDITERITYN